MKPREGERAAVAGLLHATVPWWEGRSLDPWCHEDCRVSVTAFSAASESPRLEGRLEGLVIQRRQLASLVTDPRLEVELIVQHGSRVAARWRMSGRTAAVDGSGRLVDVETTGSGIGEFRDGRLSAWREIWDTLSVLQQIGAVDLPDYPGQ